MVAPFEFRSLAGEDVEMRVAERRNDRQRRQRRQLAELAGMQRRGRPLLRRRWMRRGRRALQQGEREGRRAARAELEAEMRAAVARERERLVGAVEQFRARAGALFRRGGAGGGEAGAGDCGAGTASRGADRSAAAERARCGWRWKRWRTAAEWCCGLRRQMWRRGSGRFAAMQSCTERPRVTEMRGLERGECVLETKMGTVELGVQVQLEEIEKGFFDLLNHRPVE